MTNTKPSSNEQALNAFTYLFLQVPIYFTLFAKRYDSQGGLKQDTHADKLLAHVFQGDSFNEKLNWNNASLVTAIVICLLVFISFILVIISKESTLKGALGIYSAITILFLLLSIYAQAFGETGVHGMKSRTSTFYMTSFLCAGITLVIDIMYERAKDREDDPDDHVAKS